MPATELTEARQIFRVPVQAYDLASGHVVSADRYLSGEPLEGDLYHNQMLAAQRGGRRIGYSNEWSGAQRYLKRSHPEQELRFVDTVAWTGTVLDFDDKTLKEGITLNDDGTIKSAKVVLGRKDKIVLPHESKYVKDLSEAHMPLMSYLHGVKDPKRELPDYAYAWVTPSGIRPVVRGGWPSDRRGGGRVGVGAGGGPADWRFAAWLVDETRPEDALTPNEYEVLEKNIKYREEELCGLQLKQSSSLVLIE